MDKKSLWKKISVEKINLWTKKRRMKIGNIEFGDRPLFLAPMEENEAAISLPLALPRR